MWVHARGRLTILDLGLSALEPQAFLANCIKYYGNKFYSTDLKFYPTALSITMSIISLSTMCRSYKTFLFVTAAGAK
jgi:hypothetical protein